MGITKYILGSIVSFPLLPIMYVQGKRIRARVPVLPEARGVSGQRKTGKQAARSLTVLSLGESTIAGVGVETHEEGFMGTLARELSSQFDVDVNWRVYARSGYTAKRVQQKLIPKIEEDKVDLIIIGLGGNDAFTLNRPGKWRDDIRSLIDSLRAAFPEAILVFCNMPPIKEFPAFTSLIKFTVGNLVEILGEELQKVVQDYEHVFYFGEKISLEGWIRKFELDAKKEAFFSDGVHPSKLTYQTWARDIVQEIAKNKVLQHLLP